MKPPYLTTVGRANYLLLDANYLQDEGADRSNTWHRHVTLMANKCHKGVLLGSPGTCVGIQQGLPQFSSFTFYGKTVQEGRLIAGDLRGNTFQYTVQYSYYNTENPLKSSERTVSS